ncbi:MAG: hypothetical protein EA392_04145, partial [Cryomorphaceae bacterium]
IQAAITAADDNDVIEVAAGTYEETLTIDKPLSLLGPNDGLAGNSEARVGEAVIQYPDYITSGFNLLISIDSDGVTISGFTLNDNLTIGLTYDGTWPLPLSARGVRSFGSNTVVEYNRFSGFNNIAVHMSQNGAPSQPHVPATTGNITRYNFFENGSVFSSIYYQAAGGAISDNQVMDAGSGIQVQPYRTDASGSVTNNQFSSYVFGIHYNYANGSNIGVSNWNFTGNSISAPASTPDWSELMWDGLSRAFEGIRVETYVETSATYAPTAHFENNNIDGDGATTPDYFGVRGVFFRNVNGDASQNVNNITFNNNTFSNVEVGVQFSEITTVEFELSVLFGNGNTYPEGMVVVPPYQIGFAPVVNVTQEIGYSTIQAAITAADDNDVIEVAAGIYDENVNINKPLTLNGANAGNDCDARVAESVIAPTSGAPVMITSDNVTLNGFEINAPNHGFAIDLSNQSNVSVVYNKVHNIGNDAGFGGPPTNSNTVHSIRFQLDAGSYSNVEISKNCISNISHAGNTFNSASAIGILQSTSQGTLSNLNIEDNSISDVNSNTGPWGDGGRIAYGVLINVGGNASFASNGKVEGAVITGNHISGLEGFISTGIGLEGNTENAMVTFNVISDIKGSKVANRAGGGYDLQALKFENNRYVGTVTVERNSFETNTFVHTDDGGVGYAVANYVDASAYGAADVSCNWFGTALAAEIEDNDDLDGLLLSKAGAEILFIPFLQSDDLQSPCDGYPAGTVFVLDEEGDVVGFFTGLTPISDGIAAALDGQLVQISSGIYDDVIDASGTPDPALTISIGESPGCVTVNGLILTDNDTYLQDIWDYTPCTGYDQLTVLGDVNLGDAVLDIELDGFVPAPGFAFEIITYTGTREGEFAQNTITINGRDFVVGYDDDNKVITVTAGGYANFTWSESNVELEACQETTVNVNIETTGPITNAELKLSYDATRLTLVSATYVGTGAVVASNTASSGEIYFAANWQGGFAGPSEGFLQIVFEGIRDEVANVGTAGGTVAPMELGDFAGTRIMNNFGFVGGGFEPLVANVLLDAEILALDVTPDVTDPVINGDGNCLVLDGSRFVNAGNGYLVSGAEFDVIVSGTDDCASVLITHNASSISGADGSGETAASSLDGWIFPVGVHEITFTASDGFNTVTCDVEITVVPQTLTGTAIINMACNDGAPVRIRVYDGSAQVGGDFTTALDASGNFATPVELTGVPAGTYTVYAKVERYLSKVFEGVDMTSSSAQPNVVLTQVIPGDIADGDATFNDDVINAVDLSLLVFHYNTALDINSPADAVRSDLNCDNFVDAIDLSFISFFFGQSVSAP